MPLWCYFILCVPALMLITSLGMAVKLLIELGKEKKSGRRLCVKR